MTGVLDPVVYFGFHNFHNSLSLPLSICMYIYVLVYRYKQICVCVILYMHVCAYVIHRSGETTFLLLCRVRQYRKGSACVLFRQEPDQAKETGSQGGNVEEEK